MDADVSSGLTLPPRLLYDDTCKQSQGGDGRREEKLYRGGGILLVTVFTVLADIFPPERLARV
jgi:hypothetical protein